MSAQRDALKLFFETGDNPTQAQFYQWLDDTIFSDEVADLWFTHLETLTLDGFDPSTNTNDIPTASATVFDALEKICKRLIDITTPLVSTGDIKFDFNRVYGRFSTPVTASTLNFDFTNSATGAVALVIHEAGAEPTYGSTVDKSLLCAVYDITKKNYMYFTCMGGSKVSLTINTDQ